MNDSIVESGAITRAELTSQPDIWQQALDLTERHRTLLPAAGEKVLIVGCGTSYYICLLYTSPSPRDS